MHQTQLGFMSVDALVTFYRGPELLRWQQLMNIQQYFPARQAGPGRGYLHSVDKKSILFSLEHLSLPIQSELIYYSVSILYILHILAS